MEIDKRSGQPPFEQLAAILRARIESGDLPGGQMIPSITTLAQEYDLAGTTVRKALAVLKDEGLIRTRPAWGTYVVPDAERP